MNERQAKRLRRAQRRYIDENQHRMEPGPTAARVAGFLRDVVVSNWHRLNHKQRGRVMGRILERGL